MTIDLRRFSIRGLHSKFDVDIPIRDNKLILVGVNGLGKTTVVNILYFLITEQWYRLKEYDFVDVTLEISGSRHTVSRGDLESIDDFREQIFGYIRTSSSRYMVPSRVAERLVSHPRFIEFFNSDDLSRASLLESIGEDLGISASMLGRLMRALPRQIQTDLFSYPSSIRDLSAALGHFGDYQVLYLPTYRRIEQDLRAIFPSLDDSQVKEITNKGMNGSKSAGRGHVELIEFGMEDVEQKIEHELNMIRDSARSQLSNLTASYLRDIIRNRAAGFDRDLIGVLDTKTVRAVLSRVEENTLDANDKMELEAVIGRIRDDQKPTAERDRYLAHFFSRLYEIYKSLSNSERNIQRLVEICNKYLDGKRLHYSDSEYTAHVAGRDGKPIDWKHLSSGEKQVASLFTHLFLSKEKMQLVIIDEPELSLSVPWQKTLLPDIVESGGCSLLVAVTHSPFIYSNELDVYAVDLAACIKEVNSTDSAGA